jgi:hypothetical protein
MSNSLAPSFSKPERLACSRKISAGLAQAIACQSARAALSSISSTRTIVMPQCSNIRAKALGGRGQEGRAFFL